MWFTNALVFSLSCESLSEIESALTDNRLKPCPPHSRFIYGFSETINQLLSHHADNSYVFTMGKEERMLPRSVINQALTEKCHILETNNGRAVKRSEKAHLREELEFELLPKAFCVQKKTMALIDGNRQRLIVNTSSHNNAAQLCSLLRKALPDIQIKPLELISDISLKFTQWLNNPNLLPNDFVLAPNCLLTSPDDDKKKFNCKGYELPADEVCHLIDSGLTATEITLIWKERIQFTINTDFTFKRIKCIEYLLDDMNEVNQLEDEMEKVDANLCLLTGELRQLIDDVCLLFDEKATIQVQKDETLCMT
jgi:recombination associated protein RdgC